MKTRENVFLNLGVNEDIFSCKGNHQENLISRTSSKLKLCSSKDIGKEVIRQAKDQEKIFIIYVSSEELISRI